MKKHILIVILFSSISYSQSSNNYQNWNKKQLTDSLIQNDIKLKKLNETNDKLNKTNDKLEKTIAELKNKKSNSINYDELINIIKENNKYWFNTAFDDYCKTHDLTEMILETNDGLLYTMKRVSAYIKSIRIVEEDNDMKNKCQKVLDFHENYIKLFEIRKALNEKYNEDKSTQYKNDINALPELELNSKLDNYKKYLLKLLDNYKDNTCLLKSILDKYKNVDQVSSKLKKAYADLLVDAHYKDYPYLINVIKNITKNVNNYSNDDLQPCVKE